MLCSFLIVLFMFLLLSCESKLYILNTSPVSDTWVTNILFHFVGFLFPFIFLQDLSSQTKDWTWALAVKVPGPSCWTTREFPLFTFFMMEYKHFLIWWYLNFLLYVVLLMSLSKKPLLNLRSQRLILLFCAKSLSFRC